MRWYCTVRVRYVFCIMLNGRTARALLGRNIQLHGICFILLYTEYVLHTYVQQLIINSTMYTKVLVYVLFSNFGNSNFSLHVFLSRLIQ